MLAGQPFGLCCGYAGAEIGQRLLDLEQVHGQAERHHPGRDEQSPGRERPVARLGPGFEQLCFGAQAGMSPAAGPGDGARLLSVQQRRRVDEEPMAHVEGDRGREGQQHDADGDRRRGDEIAVRGAQQDQSRQQGIDGVVPDQGRQQSPSQDDVAEDDAGEADFDAADVERLLWVTGMGEAPDDRRYDDGQPALLDEALQEGNGKGPRGELLRDGRHEPDQEDDDPGDVGIHHFRVADVSRAPGPELVGGQVEERLVGDEHGGQRQADDGAQQEPLGADAVGQELLAEADLVGESAPVFRFGPGGEDGDPQGGGEGHEEAGEQLLGEKTAVGVRSVEVVVRQRQHVELGQQRQDEGDRREHADGLPAHVLQPDVGDEDDDHGDPREHHQGGRHHPGCLIAGAQLTVFALPGFGHLQELSVAADEVPLDADPQAVRRFFDLEIPELPGEGVIGAVGTRRRHGLDEFEGRQVSLQRVREEALRGVTGGNLVEGGPLLVLLDQVGEADEFARRRVFDAELLFLELPDPTAAPAPQAHRIAQHGRGPFEAELALEEGLGLIVVFEDAAVAVTVDVETAMPQERMPLVPRLIARQAEVDRRLGEGLVEVVGADEQTDGRNADADGNQAHILRLQTLFHSQRSAASGRPWHERQSYSSLPGVE